MISFLQINTNRSEASMDLAAALASNRGATYVLVSEPNIRVVKGPRWLRDNRSDAAIGYVGKKTEVSASGGGNGFVWAVIQRYTVYSCYISPNVTLEDYEVFLEGLAQDLRARGTTRTILTGDFNAKSPFWGASFEDTRGRLLAEMLISLGYEALNQDGVHTFNRNGSGSTIDVTAVTEDILGAAKNWRVLEDEESLSPHRYITFDVTAKNQQGETWAYGPISVTRLRAYLERLEEDFDVKTPARLVDILGRAYRGTTDKLRTSQGYAPYWWTQEISTLRKSSAGSRRKLIRARTAGKDAATIERLNTEYKTAKRSLRQAINRSKKSCWKSLLADLDNDLYGDGYKIVTRALKVPYPPLRLTREAILRQVDKLFPASPPKRWETEPPGNIPLFRMQELVDASNKLKSRKSPGPDGIPAEVIKVAVTTIGNYVLDVMNGLLRNGDFPKIWKHSRVVLIPKPIKTPGQDATYRPICLVDTCAKLYEQLIKTRLEEEIDGNGGLAEHQFGFRKGRSTMDAIRLVLDRAKAAHRSDPSEWCAMAAIDVRNAFNTVDWGTIIEALGTRGISAYLCNVIKRYLCDRSVTAVRGAPPRQVNVGVPQGSILGPLLWNIMYDALLSINLPPGVIIIGYADDIALVGRDRNWHHLERKMEDAIARTNNWLTKHKLTMAPEKTEAMVLKFGRRSKEWAVTLLGQPIGLSPSLKYLGVVLDAAVSFGPHIKITSVKAEASAKALGRLMPNIGGPSEKKRRTLCAAVHSILLYGAPVWAQAMRVASYRRSYQSVQRKLGLRISRAYRTTSYDATMVLASLIPIHLLAEERSRIWNSELPRSDAKKAERVVTLAKWQEEWAQSSKGAWTRRLIPEVRPWLERKHGELTFHLSQALSGHGSFRSYTHRIHKTQDNLCAHCREEDTADHTLFHCSRYEQIRRGVTDQVGESITPENLIQIMLSTEENWRSINTAITEIMRDKELQEQRS